MEQNVRNSLTVIKNANRRAGQALGEGVNDKKGFLGARNNGHVTPNDFEYQDHRV